VSGGDAFGIEEAVALAERAHAGQVDKAGAPYIEHVRRVVAAVAPHGATVQVVAALHDVVEDTSLTLDDLAVLGVPQDIVQAIDALTHRAGESYETAVARAAAHPIARLVKRADYADNSDEARLALLSPGIAEKLRAKYASAWRILSSADAEGERR
jgi:(p)ppGpp synthase/HD superfamily hydrolase